MNKNIDNSYAEMMSTRDMFTGTSFKMSDGKINTFYTNDSQNIDFISYNGGFLYCTRSHGSSENNKPELILDENNIPIGILPNMYGSFIFGGTKQITEGVDIVIPQFKLSSGILYVSYNNGNTGIDLGQVKGSDGKDGMDGKDGNDGKDGIDGTNGEDGSNGKDGENGISSRTVFAYYSTGTSTLQPDIPEGGGVNFLTNEITYPIDPKSKIKGSDNSDLDGIVGLSTNDFFSNGVENASGTTPIRITGPEGKPGEDGINIEFAYHLFKSEKEFNDNKSKIPEGEVTLLPTDTKQDENWTDNPQGIDNTYIIEACSQRVTNSNGEWSNWSTPFIWSKWGEDGTDGDGVEYIYKIGNKNSNSDEKFGPIGDDNHYTSHEDVIQNDDFIPNVDGINDYVTKHNLDENRKNILIDCFDNGGTDQPSDVSDEEPVEWVSIRKKKNGVGGKFSKPIIGNEGHRDGYDSYTANYFAVVHESLDLSNYKLTVGTYDSPTPKSILDINGNEITDITITGDDSFDNTKVTSESRVWMINTCYVSNGNVIPNLILEGHHIFNGPILLMDNDNFQVEYANKNGTKIPAPISLESCRQYIGENYTNVLDVFRDKESENGGFWYDSGDNGLTNPTGMITSQKINGKGNDGTVTRIKGEQGEPGANGTSLSIKGKFETLDSLTNAYYEFRSPTQSGAGTNEYVTKFDSLTIGDCYVVAETNDIWCYLYASDDFDLAGINLGNIKGIDGNCIYIAFANIVGNEYKFTESETGLLGEVPGKYLGICLADSRKELPFPSTQDDVQYFTFSLWEAQDGYGKEEIFIVTETNEAPDLPSIGEILPDKGNAPDFIPGGGSDGIPETFTSNKYCWMAGRYYPPRPEHLNDDGYNLFRGTNGKASFFDYYPSDGKDGITKFKSIVFTRSVSQPTKPIGGNINAPNPTDGIWKDGIPKGRDPIWSSSRLFSNEVGFIDEDWTDPVLMCDTPDFEVIYGSLDNITDCTPKNATPFYKDENGGIKGWLNDNNDYFNDKWSDYGDTNSIWMATINKTDGKWGDWTISKIKGETGDAGLSVFITYNDTPLTEKVDSPTGNGTEDGWHTDATEDVVWMSQKISKSADLGDWSRPIPIRGIDGSNGENGLSIIGKGELNTAPSNPQTNGCYRNTLDGIIYIYDGEGKIMTRDGSDGIDGADGADGDSICTVELSLYSATYSPGATYPQTTPGTYYNLEESELGYNSTLQFNNTSEGTFSVPETDSTIYKIVGSISGILSGIKIITLSNKPIKGSKPHVYRYANDIGYLKEAFGQDNVNNDYAVTVGKVLAVTDDSNNIIAGITNGNPIIIDEDSFEIKPPLIFAGASDISHSNRANFRVYNNGTIYAGNILRSTNFLNLSGPQTILTFFKLGSLVQITSDDDVHISLPSLNGKDILVGNTITDQTEYIKDDIRALIGASFVIYNVNPLQTYNIYFDYVAAKSADNGTLVFENMSTTHQLPPQYGAIVESHVGISTKTTDGITRTIECVYGTIKQFFIEPDET